MLQLLRNLLGGRPKRAMHRWARGEGAAETEAFFKERDTLTVPDNPSDSFVKDSVQALLANSMLGSIELKRLELLGVRAEKQLITALRDDRYLQMPPGAHPILGSPPVVAVLDCLSKMGSTDHLLITTDLCSSRDKHIRKAALRAAAATGSHDAIDIVCRALADEDEYVRSATVDGLTRAASMGVLTHELFSEVREYLRHFIREGEFNSCAGAVEVLVCAGSDSDRSWVRGPEVLSTKNRRLAQTLRILRRLDHLPNFQLLNSLLDQYRQSESWNEYPNDVSIGGIVQTLAVVPGAVGIESVVTWASESENDWITQGAFDAAMASAGFPDFDMFGKAAGDSTDPIIETVLVLFRLEYEVVNGGFGQWFVNGGGARWRAAINGADMIGAPSIRAAIESACAVLGRDAPTTKQGVRKRYASLSAKAEARFDAPSKLLYASKSELWGGLARHILTHQSNFRSLSK